MATQVLTVPVNVTPVNKTFVDKQTLITADWLNFLNQIANTPGIIPTQAASVAPTTGTWNTGDYVRNNAVTVLGVTPNQYIVDGWTCVVGGTPGQWFEVHLAVAAPPSSAPAPAPSPPALVNTYDYTYQAELFTGAVLGSSLAGYTGTGYADYTTSASTISATFTNVPEGTYNVNVRYYDYTNQQNSVVIDGGAPITVQYPALSPNPNWQVATVANVVLHAKPAPVANTLTTSTTGGTLAAGTYYYKVSAVDNSGETLPSNELSVTTTGTTSSNTLSWSAVSGATSYKVYRGTATNAENVFYTPGNVTSYVDTNAASTAGSPATTNNTTASHTIALTAQWGYTHYDYVEVKVVGAAPAPPPAPAPAPAASPINFGARSDGAYPYGIHVTAYTNSQMDAMIQAAYTSWKSNRLQAVGPFTPTYGIYAGTTVTGGYYDYSAQPLNGVNGATGTVSEAMGYAMLICVIMAGYDANAKTYFDGLFKVVRGRPSYANPTTAGGNIYQMEWRLNNDTALTSAGQGYSALDGDMDIALALFMANRQWGSAGAINYYQEALNTVGAIKAQWLAPSTGNLPGLPWYSYQNMSRTSDYMLGHFTTFKKFTNDTIWDSARSSCITLMQNIITGYSNTAKLLPDWIYQPLTSAAAPSPGGKIEGPYEGDFAQNAVRDPWRLGIDFVFSNDANVHTICSNMVNEIKTVAGSSATNTSWAYDLAGNNLNSTGGYYEPTTDGCQMVGAMVDAAHQTWLNNLFTQVGNNYNVSYFSAELELLGMISASGNWWRP